MLELVVFVTSKLKPEGGRIKCDAKGWSGGFSKQKDTHGLLVMMAL